MLHWLKIFGQAAKAWNADNAFKHSAAVSFYTLFSLAPVTIIAVTVAGWFLGRDAATHQLEVQMTQLIGPAGAETILAAAKASQKAPESPWATALGVGLVIFGATTVFAQLQDSMNSIWGVRAKPGQRGCTDTIKRLGTRDHDAVRIWRPKRCDPIRRQEWGHDE